MGLPNGLFPLGFPTKTLYAPQPPIRATCPASLITTRHYESLILTTFSVSGIRLKQENNCFISKVPCNLYGSHHQARQYMSDDGFRKGRNTWPTRQEPLR
jgi:hypothetical protein